MLFPNLQIAMSEDNIIESLKTTPDQIVEFTLDELNYAIHLNSVVRVIHAVEIRFLPEAPEIISGIINVHGRIIPVINIRKRFGLEAKEINPDNRIIIADTGKRQIALLADTVTGMRYLSPGQVAIARKTLPFAEHLSGVAKVDEGLILIYDLEKFLSLDEEEILKQALKRKKK